MDANYTFALLHPSDVHLHWSKLRELLEKAVAYNRGEIEVDDIPEAVDSGQMFVVVLQKDGETVLAMACEILKHRRKKILHISYAGGHDGKIMAEQFYPRLEEIGKLFGVSLVQCFCRPAIGRYLQRLFPDVGCAYMVMHKEVAL